MTRILAHFYNAVPSGCPASFVKRETQARDKVTVYLEHTELQELQKALQQGRSERKPEAYC